MEHYLVGDIDLAKRFEGGLSEAERAAATELEQTIIDADRAPDPEDAEILAEIAGGDEVDADAAERSGRPRFELPVQPVENFELRVAEIDTLKAGIRRQREDGDISFEEAEARLDQLNDQRAEFVLQQRDAVRAYQINERSARGEWSTEVTSFLSVHDEYVEDPVLWDALDATVKRLANAVDANGAFVNGDKDAGWFLREAHRRVSARARSDAADDGGADDAPARLSLNDVSRLTGLELEDALSRMTPDQVSEYLRGA